MLRTPALLFLWTVGAVDPSCRVINDVDINPHTAGLGSVPARTIDSCCDVCRSPAWWARGCRFSTLSRGRCWLKSNNATVAPSPGKTSVQCTAVAPPPPPPPLPPPPPPKGTTGPWHLLGPKNVGDDIYNHGEAGTLCDAVSPASNPNLIWAGGQNNGVCLQQWLQPMHRLQPWTRKSLLSRSSGHDR
jgi:hypothetical protein